MHKSCRFDFVTSAQSSRSYCLWRHKLMKSHFCHLHLPLWHPYPTPPPFKLQTTPLRMTSTLYSEQIEVLFCFLVNILHTISDIYMTAKKKKTRSHNNYKNNYSICCWFFFQSLAIWSSLKLGMLASSSGKM